MAPYHHENPPGTLVLFGGAVKIKGEGKIGGHLVLFVDESHKDLAAEVFTANTDFPDKVTPYCHHGLDEKVGLKKLSDEKAEIGIDHLGVWIEAQREMWGCIRRGGLQDGWRDQDLAARSRHQSHADPTIRATSRRRSSPSSAPSRDWSCRRSTSSTLGAQLGLAASCVCNRAEGSL